MGMPIARRTGQTVALRGMIALRELRTVTAVVPLHYYEALFILEPNNLKMNLARKLVTVCEPPTLPTSLDLS